MQAFRQLAVLAGHFSLANSFRQRIVALFLFVVTLLGIGIPPASVAVALASNPDTAAHTASSSPAPLPQVNSKYAAAADAVSTSPGSTAQFLSKLTGKSNSEALSSAQSLPKKTFTPHELTNQRTAYTSTYQNQNGSLTKTIYAAPHFYQNNGSWNTISTKLVPDNNAADSGNIFGKAFGALESLVRSPDAYTVKNNSWLARFAPSGFDGGMVRIKQGDSQIGFSPLHANAVKPQITTDSKGQQTVHYNNLWKGVDVDYIVESDQVKEAIILSDKDATAQVQFKLIGATLQKPQTSSTNKNPQPAFTINGALNNELSINPTNLILNNFGQVPEQTSGLAQTYDDGVLTESVSSTYLQSLPAKAFPAVIDPTVENSAFGTRSGGNYVSFETNGYVCNSSDCDLYAGSLYDQYNVLEYWRGAFYSPYNFLQGGNVVLNNANLHLTQLTGVSWWTGTTDTHNFQVGHATCLNNYGCVDGIWDSGNVSTAGDINVTNLYQDAMQQGDWGRWLMLIGQDGTTSSFKSFDPNNTFVTFTYSYVPPTPTVTTPSANNQVFVDPQVSFRVSPEANPNTNAPPLQYVFRVSSNPDGSGTVVNSGAVTAPEWTIPDDVLQDGSTYYISTASYDPGGGGYSAWSGSRPFKVDTREGQDSTQTSDSVGPVNVDLATGNLTTAASSHTTQALGGTIGVGLDYNSPQRSRAGLVGEYWSVPSGYPGGAPSRPADLTRVDQNVDFDWGSGAPASSITNSWFFARWSGYFVAPVSGTYYFGGQADDAMSIYVNNNYTNNNNGTTCYASPCFGDGVTLTAGQLIPLRVEYEQATGADYAHVYVKGPVSQQVVPQAWLQTGVRPIGQNNGLIGHYYYDDGSHNITSTNKTQFLSRTDSLLSFNWNGGSPIPNGPSANFMAQWTGYVTAPTTGTYYFGAQADDGSQVIVNGTTVEDNWQVSNSGTLYGSSIQLTAGQPVPLTVNYFQANGGDSFSLYVKSADGTTVPEQVVPSSWFTTNAQVLPAGWSLNIDADGSVSYTHLQANNNDAVLSDGTGDTYEYTWNGSSYAPPTNGGGGQLIRNNDGTFTLQATDGRTYIFGTDGTLTSVTSPVDDRNPAALQYTYGGTPAHLTKITDGVTPNRSMQMYYSGASQCGTSPTGFDAQAPSGMICAAQTNDGRTTYFYYLSGDLARISQPGNQNTDYQYDSLGRIVAVRDSLADDAVAAGIRQADGTETTQIAYDAIGRVTGVTLPAATANATRQAKTYSYYAAGQPPLILNRYNGIDHAAFVSTPPAGYYLEGPLGYLLISQVSGTHPLYSCKAGSSDEFTSYLSNCEGQQTYEGLLGFAYDAPPANIATAQVFRCAVNGTGDHFDSLASNCEGQNVNGSLGYFPTSPTTPTTPAYTDVHVAGASEPNGFSEEVTYDNLFRTTKVTDVQGLSTTTAWDPVRDLRYASTNPLGLMTTTVYDDEDRPVTSYGPAPSSWFTSSTDTYGHTAYTPQPAYAAQVARSDTAYDQGMDGLATSYATYTPSSQSLTGAPFLHTTNFGNPAAATLTNDFGASSPSPSVTSDWGMTMTGKMRLPSTGNYTFRIASDGGVLMWIDGVLAINDWTDGSYRSHPTYTFTNSTVNSPHDVQIEYYHTTGDASFSLNMTPPGGSETNQVAQYFSPDYSLTTSTTAYDSALGNVTATTNYGNRPELGLPQSSTTTGGSTSLTTDSAYEAASTGYLRKTSTSLPGGATTSYSYYAGSDTAANPCVQGSAAAYQGGMLHVTTQPTGVTLEKVYDDAGNVVASRNNTDPWTCTTYDSRGRVAQTIVPTINGRSGRVLTYNYAVGGNPLIGSVTDSTTGTTTAQVDLLRRTTTNTDTFGYQTTYAYDNLGRPATTQSLTGTESVTYDNYSRPVTYAINGTTYATITYDQYGRTASVNYPQATNGSGSLGLTQIKYDAQQQTDGSIYTFSDGTTYNESVSLDAQTGMVTGDSIAEGGKTANSTYQYDGVGRLTGATIDNWQYQYGFGAQDASCSGIANFNPNASADGNRTNYSVTNTQTSASTTTSNCYNTADQIVTSTDAQIGTPTYDADGNVTQLAGNGAPITFTYNASGQNTAIQQGGNQIKYTKDADGDILVKEIYQNNVLTNVYRYVDGGNVLLTCSTTNESQCSLTDSYMALPGGVALTVSGGNKTYSLQNFHGDTAMTIGSNGTPTSAVYLYDPFGQTIASATFDTNGEPANATDAGMGWATNPTRKQESLFTLDLMQMGARVYIPSLGRFLQPDPVQGGTPNAYVYVLDPVNFADYSGEFGIHINWGAIGRAVVKAAKVALIAIVVVGVMLLAAALITVDPEGESTIASDASRVISAASSGINRAASVLTKASSAVAKSGGSPEAVKAAEVESRVSETVQADNGLGEVGGTTGQKSLSYVQSQLESGRAIGSPISGVGTKIPILGDPNYPSPWIKMSVPAKDFGEKGYDIHYMLNPWTGEWNQLKLK